ncbi:hypothetical protein T484DRAFT_1929404, partial [Baffinella frigidus]
MSRGAQREKVGFGEVYEHSHDLETADRDLVATRAEVEWLTQKVEALTHGRERDAEHVQSLKAQAHASRAQLERALESADTAAAERRLHILASHSQQAVHSELLEEVGARSKADRSVSAGQLRQSAEAILALEDEVQRNREMFKSRQHRMESQIEALQSENKSLQTKLAAQLTLRSQHSSQESVNIKEKETVEIRAAKLAKELEEQSHKLQEATTRATKAERVERDREMEIKTLKEQVYSQAANLVSDKMNRFDMEHLRKKQIRLEVQVDELHQVARTQRSRADHEETQRKKESHDRLRLAAEVDGLDAIIEQQRRHIDKLEGRNAWEAPRQRSRSKSKEREGSRSRPRSAHFF